MTETQVDQEPNIDKLKGEAEELTPREVLHYWMTDAHTNGQQLLELLVNKLKSDAVASPAEILRIVTKLGDHVTRAIDTSAKLMQFYHPKLEAIEVKNEVEHHYVIKAPDAIKSVDEWARLTGAETLRCRSRDQDRPTFGEPVPSIHDYGEQATPKEAKELEVRF